jgi:hypothetical protein
MKAGLRANFCKTGMCDQRGIHNVATRELDNHMMVL